MIVRILILIKVNKTKTTTLLMPLIFVFTRDVWIRTQRAAVASMRATNLATFRPTQIWCFGPFMILENLADIPVSMLNRATEVKT